MPMRTLLASIFCLCAVTVFGQEFRKTDFATGSLTNVPAAVKVLYVRSTNDATNTATISGVGYSLRY